MNANVQLSALKNGAFEVQRLASVEMNSSSVKKEHHVRFVLLLT